MIPDFSWFYLISVEFGWFSNKKKGFEMVLGDRCEYDFDINFPTAIVIGLINNADANEKLGYK